LEAISAEETLLSLASSPNDAHSPSPAEVLAREQVDRARTRQLTFLDGLAIVVSLQIGAGIFSAPAQVAQHVLSPGTAMVIWLLGGLLVWTGAACFIELGLIVPQNGGVQEYLRFCYGDFMGFLFTWTWITISKPASMAVISRVFAEHLCHILLQSKTPSWLIKLVALLGIWTITGVNCAGAKTGVKVANAFLILKLLTVVSVAAIGIVAGVLGYGDGVRHDVSGRGWFDSIESPDLQNLPLWERIGNTVTAFFGALYCYSGWESVSSH
jgi:solute carrier family 7 (L-type amino acid transporter), member 6